MDAPALVKEATLYSKNGKSWDIRQFTSFNHYEDLLKPAITMKISFLDSAQSGGKSAFKDLPIKEGETSISIIFVHPTDTSVEYVVESDNTYLYKPGSLSRGSGYELVTLDFTSPEAIKNYSTRVTKKYKGLISQTVKSLMSEVLETSKKIDIEETQEQIDVKGNNRRILSNSSGQPGLIPDLSRRAIPSSGNDEDAGYLFYETSQGYHFKSLNFLLKQSPVATYTATTVNKASYYRDNNFIIMTYRFESTGQDIAKIGDNGGFGGKRCSFDFATQKATIVDPKLSDTSIGAEKQVNPPIVSEGINEVIFEISDTCSSQEDSDFKGKKSHNYNRPWDISSKKNYNSVFNSQKLSMTVPFNPTLKAGDVIEINFPQLDPTSNDKDIDDHTSGNYLIKELNHNITKKYSVTNLKVLRNSFGRT
jgi:hypothetical protein